ncbi:hypothetical protein C8C83_4683 [Flavobacterium sp. 90]|uniref:hypothetical protein n=1 Tax=unclassified Flavobacterium TaxID=196869 RepID=UPI000EAD16AD|nr:MULTISPECIES: hypothetical protein [unclassified Flavobacterium]RKR05339.1 hypothetical protein C8C82_5026 [Flavobacterium sp. 81]TCK56653.1 hypothetical protein C8C83_4683 [Flavobacterium sp. 90]
MKSQKGIFLIILIYFLSLLNSYAQNDVNKLFFNLPLESNRDTIYSSIKKYGFIEKHSNRTVSQDDNIIKTFDGYLDTKTSGNVLADSIQIQLSTGGTILDDEKYYQNLLIIWSYYHFSNAKTAKIFYRDKKLEIEKIIPEKPVNYKNSEDKIKTDKDDRKVSIQFKREKQEYIVRLEYLRNEGEKKLKRQFVKKEFIFREIDSKNLFLANNVEQVPITKKCSTKNDKSIECFKESIANQIWTDVDFYTFGLTPGAHRIFLKFVIDKNKQIINIKVNHKNSKLCEEITRSINQINIAEPAINKGLKVDFLAEIPLTISINN